MEQILKAIQSLQLEALKNGVSFAVSYLYNDDSSFSRVNVDVKYNTSIGDVSDRRSFITSISAEDTIKIQNKKLAQLTYVMEQATDSWNTINDIAETEE